jgi:hypothetical protein
MAKSKPNLPKPDIPKLEKNYQRYRGELEKLETKYNGYLNPHDIVREASNESSPIHDWFDWDDKEASEKWRLHQARLLINSVKIRVVFPEGTREYRKYLNVKISRHDDKSERAYVNTKVVLSQDNYKQQVLKRAIREAEYWQRQYEEYQELEDIFKGITRTKKKLMKKNLLVAN